MADTPAAPAAAQASVSDADLVSDILAHQGPNEPAQAVTEGEEQATEGGDTDTDETDDSHDDEDSTEEGEEAEASKATGPLKAALAQVKKALEAGELDPKEIGLTNKEWTAFRKANAAERQKVAGERAHLAQWHQNAQAQLNQAIQQLTPMEPWYLAEQAFNRDGDPIHFIRVLEERTKLEYDTIQKLVLNKQKISPEVRRLREEAAARDRRLAELEAKLTQPAPVDPAVVEAKDMAYIRENLADPADAKIPNFHRRVYKVLLSHMNKVGQLLPIEQAAARVRHAEQKRFEASPHYKKPAAVAEAPGKKKKSLLRKDSQSEGASPDKPMSNNDLVDDILRKHKIAGAAVGR